jgi:hypothetical protein
LKSHTAAFQTKAARSGSRVTLAGAPATLQELEEALDAQSPPKIREALARAEREEVRLDELPPDLARL